MLAKTKVSVAIVMVLGLSACTPAGEEPRRASTGAVFGAAVGGLHEAARTGSRTAAARGAIIGGAVGVVAGSMADQRAMREAINDPNVQVSGDGSNVTIVFPNSLLFPTSSATLSSVGQADMVRLANFLRSQPTRAVTVIGHTDSSGSLSYNQILSEHRARGVTNTLIAGGVSPARITTLGQGPTRPISSNDTAEGRANNRRVEIIVRPPS